MANQNKESDAFFEHFSSGDKPTKAGAGLVRALARKIFKYAGVAPGGSVLEIGPGRGDFADICLKAGIQYSAIEANRQMAESLQAKGAHVVRAMAPPLPALDKQFDSVVMINVMEHMNDVRDALAITGQIRDVLKPKGRFVICSPDYLNWRRNFFNCDFSHNYVTTRRRLDQLLVNAGYTNIRSRYMSGPFSGWAGVILSAVASHLPFGAMEALSPGCPVCSRLYKLQLTFSRRVLIMGQNTA